MEVFDCKKCGHCCEGIGGIVLTAHDLERICKFLNLAKDVVKQLYTEEKCGKRRLQANEAGACVFFKKGIGCAIHPAKPDVCRAWPFFRGNLADELSLKMAMEFCPGINPAVSFQDFRKHGKDHIKNNALHHPEEDAPNALNFSDIS